MGPHGNATIGPRLGVVTEFAADLRRLGPANFLYADAEILFAHGHRRIHLATGRIEPPGLFRLSQACGTAQPLLPAQTVTLIASVPLGTGDWRPFAEGEVVAVSAGTATTQIMPPMSGASPDSGSRTPDAPAR